ncbi:MAG TPA: hypothetical protein VM901_03630 [Bdellovibrionota bacterium]|jgi:hypothetical protein|nr:hypothetical protein [Bdellovibrionota bacterium]
MGRPGKSYLGLWLALAPALVHGAEPHGSGAQKEAMREPINWKRMMEGIDRERTVTMNLWWASYARDRNQPDPPDRKLEGLSTKRQLNLRGVDRCFAGDDTSLSYGEMIARNIDNAMKERIIRTNSEIDKGYSLMTKRLPVGLYSNPMCAILEGPVEPEFRHSLHENKYPGLDQVKSLNDYLLYGNHLVNLINRPNLSAAAYEEAVGNFKAYQGIMMACLGYAESLTDTDNSDADEMYRDLRRRGYVKGDRRPEGVVIGRDYYGSFFTGSRSYAEQVSAGVSPSMLQFKDARGRDRQRYLKYPDDVSKRLSAAKGDAARAPIVAAFVQSQLRRIQADRASGLSESGILSQYFSDIPIDNWMAMGMYQFKFSEFDTDKGDVLSGNVGPCVAQWNDQFGSACPVQNTISGLAEALSSSGQAFNIFCGTQKILQSYNVQIHTTDPTKTSPQNLGPDGKLLPPEKRCVHPFWFGSKTYNHFGPLANSVQKGSIPDLPSFPGNQAILMECIHKNGARVFGGRR